VRAEPRARVGPDGLEPLGRGRLSPAILGPNRSRSDRSGEATTLRTDTTGGSAPVGAVLTAGAVVIVVASTGLHVSGSVDVGPASPTVSFACDHDERGAGEGLPVGGAGGLEGATVRTAWTPTGTGDDGAGGPEPSEVVGEDSYVIGSYTAP
jgi:hypothetical protein